jgi:hypothetical protein
MTVNPNYLHRYPTYDVSGSRIYVDDAETRWVVLVPISYQDQEDLIRSTYQHRRAGALLGAKLFGEKSFARLRNQSVKFIWTANDQNYFTFNPQIEYVTDPIIQVMTLSNSSGDDRLNAVNSDIDRALKVYLGNNSGANVLAEFEPTLSELNLDDDFVSLLSFSEFSTYALNESSFFVGRWGLPTVILLSVMIMLIVQSAVINYEREARWIAVVKIRGYRFRDCYVKPILRFLGTWLITIATIVGIYFSSVIDIDVGSSRFMDRLVMTINQYNQFRYADPTLITGVLAAFVLFDVLITIGAFKLIESRRVVTTLKGET